VDDWMRVPGASVQGHRAVVRVLGGGAEMSCTCGSTSPVQPSAYGACLALVLHLEAAVRGGATVVGPEDDGDGRAGVREPRRPVPSGGSGSVAVDEAPVDPA
jgi:hypothetical protein